MFEKRGKKSVFRTGIFISVCFHLLVFFLSLFALKQEEKAGGAGFFMEAFLLPKIQGALKQGEETESQKPLEIKKTEQKSDIKSEKKEETLAPQKPLGGAVGDLDGLGAGSAEGVGLGSQSGLSEVELARYFVRLRRFFQKRLVYPQALKGQKISGKVLLRFELQENREVLISSIEIVSSSGHEVLDVQAVKILQEAKKIPKPPLEKMKIELPIVFRVYP